MTDATATATVTNTALVRALLLMSGGGLFGNGKGAAPPAPDSNVIDLGFERWKRKGLKRD